MHCVIVVRDVLLHVDSQARFFNRNQFLDEVNETERPFYEKVRIVQWCTSVQFLQVY